MLRENQPEHLLSEVLSKEENHKDATLAIAAIDHIDSWNTDFLSQLEAIKLSSYPL